jgi:hypothetical protein
MMSSRSRRGGVAIASVVNSVGLIVGISVGVGLPVPGLAIYLTGLLGGAIALMLSFSLTHRLFGRRLPPGAVQLLAALGIIQGMIFTGLLIYVLPPFYATWNQPQEPTPIAIAQLPAALPSLPAYVSLTGYPQFHLTVEDSYRLRRSQNNQHPRTITVTWIPLVAQNWRSSQMVQVMVESSLLGGHRMSDRPVTVAGMLFSLHPKDRAHFIPADMILHLSHGVGVSGAGSAVGLSSLLILIRCIYCVT